MKAFVIAIVMGAVGASLAWGATALAIWAHVRGTPLGLVGQLAFDSLPPVRLAIVVMVLSVLAVPILFLVDMLKAPKSMGSPGLRLVGLSMLGLGVLGATYSALILCLTIGKTGVTRLEVIAPVLAEIPLVLGIGLLAAAWAAGANAILASRVRPV